MLPGNEEGAAATPQGPGSRGEARRLSLSPEGRLHTQATCLCLSSSPSCLSCLVGLRREDCPLTRADLPAKDLKEILNLFWF